MHTENQSKHFTNFMVDNILLCTSIQIFKDFSHFWSLYYCVQILAWWKYNNCDSSFPIYHYLYFFWLIHQSTIIIHHSMCEKCPEFFLVSIFPHSDWIRRDTSYLSVFSPNARKYRLEKTPCLETFRTATLFVTIKNMIYFRVNKQTQLAIDFFT